MMTGTSKNRRGPHPPQSLVDTEASAVKAHLDRGMSLASGMEIGYVVRDAGRWVMDIEGDASGFYVEYYGKLLEKAWQEAAFVFR